MGDNLTCQPNARPGCHASPCCDHDHRQRHDFQTTLAEPSRRLPSTCLLTARPRARPLEPLPNPPGIALSVTSHGQPTARNIGLASLSPLQPCTGTPPFSDDELHASLSASFVVFALRCSGRAPGPSLPRSNWFTTLWALGRWHARTSAHPHTTHRQRCGREARNDFHTRRSASPVPRVGQAKQSLQAQMTQAFGESPRVMEQAPLTRQLVFRSILPARQSGNGSLPHGPRCPDGHVIFVSFSTPSHHQGGYQLRTRFVTFSTLVSLSLLRTYPPSRAQPSVSRTSHIKAHSVLAHSVLIFHHYPPSSKHLALFLTLHLTTAISYSPNSP